MSAANDNPPGTPDAPTQTTAELNEGLEQLGRLVKARCAMSERLAGLIEHADDRGWNLPDADWELIELATVKLEELTAAIDEGHRLLGIHANTGAKH